jgi:transcriptional regulator of heat shock response
VIKVKGKRGFQKGNKLASKQVKAVARLKSGKDPDVLDNARSTVLEILSEKGINAAHEMVKAARHIKDPEKKFRAWRDIHSFIEGSKKSTEVKVTKSEDKTVRIIYQDRKVEQSDDRKLMERVTEEIIDAEFKEVEDELRKELQDDIIGDDNDESGSEESK